MNANHISDPQRNIIHIAMIAITTIATILISFYYLFSGSFIVFQNLFYIPIILSCIYYTLRGFIYSVCLAVLYLLMILFFSSEHGIIMQALVRVALFIIIAGIITLLIIRRKRTEETLQDSENKFSAAFNTNPIPTAISDIEDGRFLNVNDAFVELFSFSSKAELIGKTSVKLGIFANPHDRQYMREDVEETGRVHNRELKMATRDGRILDMLFSAEPVLVNNKQCLLTTGVDITSRKQAENALNQSREQYRAFVENINDVIFTVDLQGKFSFVSPAIERISGYTSAEVEGKLFSDFVHPDDLIGLEKALSRRVDPLTITEHEFRVLDKTETVRWVVTKSRLVAENDKPLVIYGIMTDITERKQMEETLQKSEANYRQLFDNSPAGIYQVDFRTGKFLKANDAFCEFLGYSQEEITSLSPYDILTNESKQLFSERLEKMSLGEKVINNPEFEIVDKKGKRIWAQLNVKNIYDSEGLAGADVVAHDITERKKAEHLLKVSEENLHMILDSVDNAIFIYTKTGKIIDVNSKMLEMYGVSRDEVCSMTIEEDFSTPDNPIHELPGIWESVVKGEDRLFEWGARRPHDGSTFNVEVFLKKIILNENDFILAAVRDITSRKQAEEEKRDLQERLNRAEKMEALGTLAGGVAHDLNNVLGIVVGYAELTLDSVDKESPLRHGLVNIFNSGQKAAAIVDDLLTLARRGVPVSSILNLNNIIKDFQQSPELKNLLSHHPAVKIKTDLDTDLLNISGSSVHLTKSLYNLISNASEAMTKGGTLTIKTTNQYLDKPLSGYDEIHAGDYVVLSVSDTGEGISEKDLKRIFEPFYTKKIMGRSGTGLGLAVVWGTVKDHNGYINVQSEEGKGSTFTLYFPVTREEIPDKAVVIDISEYLGKGQSILIVDDVKDQRDLATEMLKKLNYNVSSVKSGEEAIVYLKEHQADLIVLDMIMDPGMDGLDTYKSIIKINPKQKTIIVSGFSESDRVKEAKRLGAGTYVRKPYIKEKLGLAVKKELERK